MLKTILQDINIKLKCITRSSTYHIFLNPASMFFFQEVKIAFPGHYWADPHFVHQWNVIVVVQVCGVGFYWQGELTITHF